MSESECGIDAPAIEWNPVWVRITVGRIGTSSPLPVVGEPQLRRRKIEPFGELDQRMMFRRQANLCLVAQQFLGQRRFADLRQLDCALDVRQGVYWWVAADERVFR